MGPRVLSEGQRAAGAHTGGATGSDGAAPETGKHFRDVGGPGAPPWADEEKGREQLRERRREPGAGGNTTGWKQENRRTTKGSEYGCKEGVLLAIILIVPYPTKQL